MTTLNIQHTEQNIIYNTIADFQNTG